MDHPMSASPQDLRTEHRDGLGIGEARPRLSWRLPHGATRQDGYELALDDGTTVRIDGDACVLVPWPGLTLGSGERREVRVRTWTDLGESPWSEPLVLEAGLLEETDWRADWIVPTATSGTPGFRPAFRLRGEVVVDRPVRRARLHATAHGIYELELDGVRVGRDELTPGFTEYGERTPTSGASRRRSSPSSTSTTTTAAPPSSAPTPRGVGPPRTCSPPT